MNRYHAKLGFVCFLALAAMIGLSFLGTTTLGETAVRPPCNWMEIGPEYLQHDHPGSVAPGPRLNPGRHMVWVAAKLKGSTAPYAPWRAHGPYQVVAGHKYLVTVQDGNPPVVSWRDGDVRLNAYPTPTGKSAVVYYLNRSQTNKFYGIAVCPGGPMITTNLPAATDVHLAADAVDPAPAKIPDLAMVGALTADHPRDPRRHCLQQVHPVNLVQGNTYILEMTSADFDTTLLLEDAAGNLLATDDDVIGNVGSRIVYRPMTTGAYRLIATSAAPSGAGAYAITVAARDVPHHVVMNVMDELLPGDFHREGFHGRSYDISMVAGQWYTINLTSNEFDTFVQLENRDGVIVAFDDEGGLGRNARIRFLAPRDGLYRIVATSFSPWETGPFALRVCMD